jgi:hypothetical protein
MPTAPPEVPQLHIDQDKRRTSSVTTTSSLGAFAQQARSVTETVSDEVLFSKNAALRVRLQPYVRHKQSADAYIREARATSVASVSTAFARKEQQQNNHRVTNDQHAKNKPAKPRPRPVSAPLQGGGGRGGGGGGRGGHPSKAASKGRAAPTTVLASSAASPEASKVAAGEDREEELEIEHLKRLMERTSVTGTVLSTDLTSPDAIKLPWGGNAQRYMEASTLDRNRSQPQLKKWDSRPHHSVPYVCRGLRAVNVSKSEPWAQSSLAMPTALDSEGKLGMGYATTGLNKSDDGMKDDHVMLFNRRRREDMEKATRTERKPWDFTPWRSVPATLRGIHSHTREPWQRDQLIYMEFEDHAREEAALLARKARDQYDLYKEYMRLTSSAHVSRHDERRRRRLESSALSSKESSKLSSPADSSQDGNGGVLTAPAAVMEEKTAAGRWHAIMFGS